MNIEDVRIGMEVRLTSGVTGLGERGDIVFVLETDKYDTSKA